jgi:uncharacterized membrane protein YjjB (DUF3815 family)
MLVQILVSFIATISFAVIFSVPRKEYIFCGLTGAIGWLSYLIFFTAIFSIVFATFFASIVITVVSRIFAVNRRLPVTIFLISGIFPLVPGAGLYYTAYWIFANEITLATVKGVETFSIALAIVFGIMLVFVIPQKIFLCGKNKFGKSMQKKKK